MRRLLLCGLFAALIPSNGSTSLQAPTFRINAVSPAPGSSLAGAPAEILVTLSDTIQAGSLGSATVQLVRDGADNAFDTPDDVTVTPASLTVVGGNQIRLDLTGVPLANDTYRLRLVGNMPISAGRVGWWRMDQSSGSAVPDSSGLGNHGTIVGNPVWAPVGGRVGGALSFDGSGDWVVVPQAASLQPLGSLSVTLWARISSVTSGFADLVRKADSNQAGYLIRWHHFTDHLWWRLDRYSNPQIFVQDTQVTTPYLNAWHHIAGVYDGATGTSSLYVDGVLRNSSGGFTGPLEHTDHLYLMGSTHPGQVAVPGLLDDVRVYSRALSLAEVQSLAAAVSDEAVTDLSGNPIDGEFGGSFPSGNASPGGHFVSTFVLDTNLPVAPSLLIATPTGTGPINLSWTDNSSNELGFKVERGNDGVVFVEIASVGAGVTFYQDAAPLGTSFYRVRAFNAAGNGGYSNPASASPAGSSSSLVIVKGCGSAGLEVLIPFALAALLRRRRKA